MTEINEINESCSRYFGTLLSCIIVCAKSEVSRMVLIDGKKNVLVLGLTEVNPLPGMHNDSHLNLRLAKTLANGSLYCMQASAHHFLFFIAFFSNPNTLSDAAGILIPSMILLGSINVRQLENGSGGLMNGMQSY